MFLVCLYFLSGASILGAWFLLGIHCITIFQRHGSGIHHYNTCIRVAFSFYRWISKIQSSFWFISYSISCVLLSLIKFIEIDDMIYRPRIGHGWVSVICS